MKYSCRWCGRNKRWFIVPCLVTTVSRPRVYKKFVYLTHIDYISDCNLLMYWLEQEYKSIDMLSVAKFVNYPQVSEEEVLLRCSVQNNNGGKISSPLSVLLQIIGGVQMYVYRLHSKPKSVRSTSG